MATVESPREQKVVVKEMSWDPITRIVGSLGIHTEIDFTNQRVNKCYSTSMIFRGFDIFMKGIDPRDAHFITSRICGICGDNHATCSCLNQNMAYGVKPPALGDLAFNLAESADYIFDHAIFNDCMANVDFCEQMVKETNPSLLAKAETTSAPHKDIHGFGTIADIMRALNPFTGEFYLETLHVARYTREMYCLFGGRHTHPSTIMPGGCSADITHQTCTDYYVRLMRYFDYVKRSVPMHDDLYDFFLQELPGYDMVGYRDTNLVNWGCFDDPDYVDYDYRTMTEWGRKRYITPGIAINGELITTDLVEINLMIRILLGILVLRLLGERADLRRQGPAGQPGRQEPSVEQGHAAEAAEARLRRQVHVGRLAAHLRQAHRHAPSAATPAAARSPASGARRRPALSTSATSRRRATRIQMVLPRSPNMPEMELEWMVPEKSNAIERDRARTYHQAYCGADRAALPGAGDEGGAGRPHQELELRSRCPRAPSAAASTRPPAACSPTTW